MFNPYGDNSPFDGDNGGFGARPRRFRFPSRAGDDQNSASQSPSMATQPATGSFLDQAQPYSYGGPTMQLNPGPSAFSHPGVPPPPIVGGAGGGGGGGAQPPSPVSLGSPRLGSMPPPFSLTGASPSPMTTQQRVQGLLGAPRPILPPKRYRGTLGRDLPPH